MSRSLRSLAIFVLAGLMFASVAIASDGVVEINQARALAGGVTPGDTPGFPVTITQPGSYRLTGNLNNPIGQRAIDVNSIDVTLDLGGFEVASTNICQGYPVTGCNVNVGLPGIASTQFLVVVRNGIVRGMGGSCIEVIGPSSAVEEIRALGCGGNGISVGDTGRVTSSFSGVNFGSGIQLGDGSVAEGNESRGNRIDGIAVAGFPRVLGGSVIANRAYQNGAYGLSVGGTGGLHPLVSRNVFAGNVVGTFLGGISLGDNLCNGFLC